MLYRAGEVSYYNMGSLVVIKLILGGGFSSKALWVPPPMMRVIFCFKAPTAFFFSGAIIRVFTVATISLDSRVIQVYKFPGGEAMSRARPIMQVASYHSHAVSSYRYPSPAKPGSSISAPGYLPRDVSYPTVVACTSYSTDLQKVAILFNHLSTTESQCSSV